MNNPIFIEYYVHEDCDCYKILNPWTEYKSKKIVLCPVSDGFELAKDIALYEINKELEKAIEHLEVE